MKLKADSLKNQTKLVLSSKKMRKQTQVNKIIYEKGEVTTEI